MKKVKLEEKKEKSLKLLSKIIYILAKIGKVVSMIGVVMIAIIMLIIPIITSNVKVDGTKHTIKIFDETIKYERSDAEIKFENKDGHEIVTAKNEVDAINSAFDYLEKNNLNKATIVIELVFVLVEATLIIAYLKLKLVDKIFSSIHKEETPFIEDNIERIRKIGIYMIAAIVIECVISILISLIADFDVNLNINGTSIVEILVVFVIAIVYEYGCLLQNKKTSKDE